MPVMNSKWDVRLMFRRALKLPLYILAVPGVIVIRLIRPWILIRLGRLISHRIGHLALNTELYLCEKDAGINVPRQPHIDICCPGGAVCNRQLMRMWRRVIHVWPTWLLTPLYRVNLMIPGGTVHVAAEVSQIDRDIYNLIGRFPSHLEFTAEEEARGEACLREMGIPAGAPIVCLLVRDSAYLDAHMPKHDWAYHSYRDCDIQNYVLAAEELADRGYYVLRMGAKMHDAMNSPHPQVIDYATNGMRSDFMDVYLGAKCEFCISTGAGWDAIPVCFRRPIIYTDSIPYGWLMTFWENTLFIPKRCIDTKSDRELSVLEIFARGVGYSLDTSNFDAEGIRIVDNTPEEIRDVAVEMVERLSSTWKPLGQDEDLQKVFWDVFPTEDKIDGERMHGEILVRIGAAFLRSNQDLLKG